MGGTAGDSMCLYLSVSCVNTSAFIVTSILQLEVDVNTVAMALLKAVKLKLKPQVRGLPLV